MISPHYLRLLDLIRDREAIVGIVGQGYVGLPLALTFVESGFRVAGFDLDPNKVAGLNQGESHIKHVGAERVAAAVAGGRFVATDDFSRLSECDAVLMCVPTPLGRHREPDMRYVRDTATTIRTHLRPGQLIVLESTTYPGTTDEELKPLLEESGLTTPGDFFLAFSPEREDPGNASFSTKSIPKLVGGVNPESTDVAVALYSAPIAEVVPVSSSRVAEAAKLLENIYRAVNIALVNELKMTFDQMDINVWEVIEAAKTKPFGFQAFYPGPGLGGHCIPLDPFYLSWKAAEYGMWTRLIELLQERGADVAYCDPHIPAMRPTRKYDLGLKSAPLSAQEFAGYDAVVLSTAHQEFKDPALYAGVRLLCDTRNAVTPPEGCRYLRA